MQVPEKLALVENHELAVAGLHALVTRYGASRFRFVRFDRHHPAHSAHLVLVDPFGGRADRLELLAGLAAHPRVATLAVFTLDVTPAVIDAALVRGATGVLSKATPGAALIDQLALLRAGEQIVSPPCAPAQTASVPAELTPREAAVLRLLASGARNADIARRCGVSVNTVKTHLRSVFRKLGVETRAQAVAAVLTASAPPLIDGCRR